MPVVQIYIGRIKFGSCTGVVYSYAPIQSEGLVVNNQNGEISSIGSIQIQTPVGFDLEDIRQASPYGDTGASKLVFDPIETGKASTGRVYISAARLVEHMRTGTGEFNQVGPAVATA